MSFRTPGLRNPLPTNLPIFTAKRTMRHYSSSQLILLVGEGDFSFSSAIATAFESAPNITATALDTLDEVLAKYHWAGAALSNLLGRGASVLYDIDVKNMAFHPLLMFRRFDVIVWNFPHAGFFSKAESDEEVILKHQVLLRAFFSNASKLLRRNGEIHVYHQSHGPYKKWQLESLAQFSDLALKERAPFHCAHYPGYVHRRGAGVAAGDSFQLGTSETYKFVLGWSVSSASFGDLLNGEARLPHQPHGLNQKWEPESLAQLSGSILFHRVRPAAYPSYLRPVGTELAARASFPLLPSEPYMLNTGYNPLLNSGDLVNGVAHGSHNPLVPCKQWDTRSLAKFRLGLLPVERAPFNSACPASYPVYLHPCGPAAGAYFPSFTSEPYKLVPGYVPPDFNLFTGEAKVCHQSHGPHKQWDLHSLSQLNGLRLNHHVPLNSGAYDPLLQSSSRSWTGLRKVSSSSYSGHGETHSRWVCPCNLCASAEQEKEKTAKKRAANKKTAKDTTAKKKTANEKTAKKKTRKEKDKKNTDTTRQEE